MGLLSSYGPHWHHTFDIYYPEDRSKGSFPVLMNIHGGGWNALDKGPYNAERWNAAGIAVVSINYRFVSEADQHPAVTVPVAARCSTPPGRCSTCATTRKN